MTNKITHIAPIEKIEERQFYSRPEWDVKWFIQGSYLEGGVKHYYVAVIDKETDISMGQLPYHDQQALLDALNNRKRPERKSWLQTIFG